MDKFMEFLRGYAECAVWASVTDSGEPLDDNYSAGDLGPEAVAKFAKDCGEFWTENVAPGKHVADVVAGREVVAGHDFWLTRNGHGAGFWDGDWPEYVDELTAAAKTFGEQHLYVTDDGFLEIL